MTGIQDSAWLAGLLEGEGHFRVKNQPKGRPKLEVQLRMGDRDVVEHAHYIVGQKNISVTQKEDNRKDTFKTMYCISWTGTTAENIMRRILPYMGIRRQAKINECLNTPNLSHHSPTTALT